MMFVEDDICFVFCLLGNFRAEQSKLTIQKLYKSIIVK